MLDNEDYKKLVKDGAEFLIGSCEPLFVLGNVFNDELTTFCSKYLTEGDTSSNKFESRLSAIKEQFEQDVVDKMDQLEYFNCEVCGWWCWGDERADTKQGQVCTDCHEEDEDNW
ncbi:hypothetical protein IACHDJAJ_00067 [Aeromonas phage vB_AdhS_TS3]|nr:hypothetical protein IACHDJAJ_00067 [Aeromonas phage vB_AdhS_TS3]